MEKYLLSYVVTTYNKFEYLRVTLPNLLENVREDEEVVVIDGGSSDGTVEYLDALKAGGRIHQFVSEKDFGEAHGFNKGMLMAQGRLIKLITDDDLFFHPAIQECKAAMLNDPSLDIVFTSGLNYSPSAKDRIGDFYTIDKAGYEGWQEKGHPFYACALGIMLKKESIPLIGLLSTINVRVDMEYFLRVSFNKKARIKFCDGYSYLRFDNDMSNSNKFNDRMNAEGFYLSNYYFGMAKEDYNLNIFKYLAKINWRWYLLFRSRLRRKLTPSDASKKKAPAPASREDLSGNFRDAIQVLKKGNEEFHAKHKNQRLTKKN